MKDKELDILKQAFPMMDVQGSDHDGSTVLTCNGKCGNVAIGIEFSRLWGSRAIGIESSRWSVRCKIREGDYYAHEFLESEGESLESAIVNFKSKFSAISDYLLKSQ